MALAVADRVKETSTTAGTGTLTLLGAVSGYQSFSAIGSGNTTYYCIVDDNTGQWEVGVGTYTSPNQLSRDSVLSSSSGGSAITFLGNIKQVFVTYPAERSVYENAAGSLVLSKVEATTGIITNLTSTSATITNLSLTSLTLSNLNIASANITTLTSTNATAASLTVSTGNLTFSSTGQRITGDMSNATVSNRLIFQTSTVSGNTAVGATPNAAAGNSSFNAFNASDVNNSSFAGLGVIGSVDVRLQSGLLGTGTYLPMTFYTGGSERMRLDTSGNLGIGLTPTYKFEVLSTSSDVARFTVLNKTIDGTGNLQVFTSTNQAADVGGSIALGGKNGSAGAFDPWAFGVIKGAKENSTSANLAGYLAFATPNSGGTIAERMRIDSSGNVGIGTASPTNKLEVSGSLNQTGAYGTLGGYNSGGQNTPFGRSGPTFGTNITNGQAEIDIWNPFDPSVYTSTGILFSQALSATTRRDLMFLKHDGNVGIGTASPGTKLHVDGGAASTYVRVSNTGSTNGLYVGVDSAGESLLSVVDAKPMKFLTTNTERMRIDSSGNVGIGGTASAFAKVEALGTYPTSGGFTRVFRGTGTIPSGTTAATESHNTFQSAVSTQAAAFTCPELMHFRANNVTLGASSAVTNQFGFYTDSLTSATNNYGFFSNIASGSNRWNFYAAGTALNYFAGRTGVGISPTTYTSYGLAVDNSNASALFKNDTSGSPSIFCWNSATSGDNIFAQLGTDGGATVRGSIDYNRAGGAVRYNTTSDYRAKDVYGAWDDAGATIDALKVYRGKMHGATLERPMMIAHEAQAVVPYAVSGEKDGVDKDGKPVYQQMDHQVLVPLLIAELQAVRARLAALEAK